jgi:hypothetical protein
MPRDDDDEDELNPSELLELDIPRDELDDDDDDDDIPCDEELEPLDRSSQGP